ncbi:DUF2975 domain-containing protein [Gramella sp. AN32]|uniref:DUF2975 domain-containing protein n=1 Tax=Christiangramia antarctica TaxID=2058158 RepID=A0ABW5WZM1_9FLAO|nr:DUF2975 domain-containing protein [Gramella sp. AN32]MCM4155232.1 hypothetical protein [Gramella sp. AN32]
MKSSTFLLTILNFSYYFLYFIWFILFGMLLFTVMFDSNSVLELFKNSSDLKIETKSVLITTLVLTLISGGVWIYILRMIKNLVNSLLSKKLFSNFQIASFKLIGQLIIAITIFDAITMFISRLIFQNRLKVEVDLFEFWIIITIGLFMILLSTIFEKAKFYKEENDLTV